MVFLYRRRRNAWSSMSLRRLSFRFRPFQNLLGPQRIVVSAFQTTGYLR